LRKAQSGRGTLSLQEVQVGIQYPVFIRLGAVVGYGYDGDSDLLFHLLVNRITDQSRAAKDGIDIDDQPQPRVIFFQIIHLQEVLGGFAPVSDGEGVFLQIIQRIMAEPAGLVMEKRLGNGAYFRLNSVRVV